MNERVSPENLLPLSVVAPAPPAELPTLAQAPVAEQKELPTLQVVDQINDAAELPTLSVTTVPQLAELKALSEPETSLIVDSVVVPKPVIAPKVVKPSALKPAVKISRVATTRARIELAAKDAAPKIVPAAKEKLNSLQLKERGIKLGRTALQSVSKPVAKQLSSHKERKLLFKPVDGIAWAFDLSGTNTATVGVEKSKVTQIVQSVLDSPLKYVTIAKTRFNELNEKLYENKSVLAQAIGCVAVAGIAYAAIKNVDLSGAPQLVEAGDAANLSEPSATTVDVPERIVNPGKPLETVAAFDQTPATSNQSTSPFEKIFVVNGGEGIVENIMDAMAENGVEVSATEAYEIYKEQDAKLDGQLITGDTYRMSNGDLGISQAGQFGWQQEMQNALEEIAKEKKKKKS